MKIDRVKELLKLEAQCVERNAAHDCDRNCAKCDLVQDDLELLEMYGMALKELEFRIPKKPVGRQNACQNCGIVEFGYKRVCYCDNCGQAIDWEEHGDAEPR